jgi:hypothetical protein
MIPFKLLGLLALVVGCAPIGDSGARLRGQVHVRGDDAPRCVLSLYVASSNFLVGSVNVGARFEETFVLAPGEDDYYATVTCQGVVGGFESSRLRLGSVATYREGVDLGTVTLGGGGAEDSVTN